MDHDNEDELILSLIDAAFDEFEHSTNRKLYPVGTKIPDTVLNGIYITPSIVHGAHLLIAHWYKNRETVGVTGVEIPYGTQKMWKRHRWVNI